MTLPFVASAFKVKVRLSPSISLPDRAITVLWSSFVVPDAALAVGASFTAFTVTVILWESVYSASDTDTVKDSLPL